MRATDVKQELVHLAGGAHALAIQILGNSEDAADAVQDAVVAVLARPSAYRRGRGPLKPWFMRVVRNRCIDLLRRRRPAGAPADGLADPEAGPERQLEYSQRDAKLQRALGRISPEQREIVVLRDYLDLSYAEISGVLDIAPGTVMSRLHRARLALKEILEEEDG